ncbi:MAG TPA: hypothetical protein VJS44_11255 [Pyrinomonadaceae bacterium]|nr:hypothetical protein [Pyrinomonadaceae bacterium]
MNYPLRLSFKILAIARQLSVTDSTGQLVFYVKQKAFKLKEAVTIFADEAQTQPLFTIGADRVIDFSARYHFRDQAGNALGSVKRQGMKSLWRSRYDIMRGEEVVLTIQEVNPWSKVFDSLFGEIPILGMFTGYVFHPAYEVLRTNGQPILRIVKEPAFFEGKFRVDKIAEMHPQEELVATLSLLMMVLLERARG